MTFYFNTCLGEIVESQEPDRDGAGDQTGREPDSENKPGTTGRVAFKLGKSELLLYR